jgi:acetolactate synthase-1/2/3 large subunit
MQLVAALDKQPGIRAVLCLFEGVVTGAADGYGRMADKPALTLLHLGPGFANGIANLHNAQRARSPILNMIGDHATDHLKHDAPLTSDIRGFASPVSRTYLVSESATTLAQTGLDALAASLEHPGSISTFVVPADHAWSAIEPQHTTSPRVPRCASVTTLSMQQPKRFGVPTRAACFWAAEPCAKRASSRQGASPRPLAVA